MPRVHFGYDFSRRRRWWDVRQGLSIRLLGGLLLLAWGVLLALHGLGLSKLPVGEIVDQYWPAPFALWGLVELVTSFWRRGRNFFTGLVVMVLFGALLLSNQHLTNVHVWTVFWAVVVVGLGIEVLRGPGFYRSRGWRRRFGPGDVTITFEGDRPHRPHRQGSHLIGDLRLDLTKEQIPDGETTYDLSALIGDIVVLVPQDLAIAIDADVSVGDIRVFGRRADGFGRNLHYETPDYAEAQRKVRVNAHLMVGDITVQQW